MGFRTYQQNERAQNGMQQSLCAGIRVDGGGADDPSELTAHACQYVIDGRHNNVRFCELNVVIAVLRDDK